MRCFNFDKWTIFLLSLCLRIWIPVGAPYPERKEIFLFFLSACAHSLQLFFFKVFFLIPPEIPLKISQFFLHFFRNLMDFFINPFGNPPGKSSADSIRNFNSYSFRISEIKNTCSPRKFFQWFLHKFFQRFILKIFPRIISENLPWVPPKLFNGFIWKYVMDSWKVVYGLLQKLLQ